MQINMYRGAQISLIDSQMLGAPYLMGAHTLCTMVAMTEYFLPNVCSIRQEFEQAAMKLLANIPLRAWPWKPILIYMSSKFPPH